MIDVTHQRNYDQTIWIVASQKPYIATDDGLDDQRHVVVPRAKGDQSKNSIRALKPTITEEYNVRISYSGATFRLHEDHGTISTFRTELPLHTAVMMADILPRRHWLGLLYDHITV